MGTFGLIWAHKVWRIPVFYLYFWWKDKLIIMFTIGQIYSRAILRNEHFNNWDGVRAFIFEEGILMGIVYNPPQDPNAPIRYCVYGKPNGTYKRLFGGNHTFLKVIPIFKNIGNNNVEFDGYFKVKYIGIPRITSPCIAVLADKILVGEIELENVYIIIKQLKLNSMQRLIDNLRNDCCSSTITTIRRPLLVKLYRTIQDAFDENDNFSWFPLERVIALNDSVARPLGINCHSSEDGRCVISLITYKFNDNQHNDYTLVNRMEII